MEDSLMRLIQKESAEALLNVGVSVPFKEFRIPFKKKPVRLRFTMRRPCLRNLILLTREYLSMGVTAAELEGMTKEQEMEFITLHTKGITRIVAYTICQGIFSRYIGIGVVAWFIRNFVDYRYIIGAFRTFVRLMGTEDFIGIIRSVERVNPMKLRLSQRMKGS